MNAASVRAYRAARIAKGQCWRCGEPAALTRKGVRYERATQCERCLAVAAAGQARRARVKLCRYCSGGTADVACGTCSSELLAGATVLWASVEPTEVVLVDLAARGVRVEVIPTPLGEREERELAAKASTPPDPIALDFDDVEVG